MPTERERERREHEKPSQVRPSQPLGNVMPRRQKPEGKISECSEVKDYGSAEESGNKVKEKRTIIASRMIFSHAFNTETKQNDFEESYPSDWRNSA